MHECLQPNMLAGLLVTPFYVRLGWIAETLCVPEHLGRRQSIFGVTAGVSLPRGAIARIMVCSIREKNLA